MKDIELPPLSKFDHPEPRTMQWSDLELYAIKSYARAAIEADRAQRVPDGWKQEAAEAIDWLLNNIRRDALQLSGKAMGNAVRVRDALLASTPAPAQQEPVYCTYPACQSTGKTCLGACAKQSAQHQEQPQQERGPMTEQEFEALHFKERGYVATGLMDIVAMVERHHGIRKD